MDLQLSGKRALVVGGSRGIGKAVARQLVEEGALVVIAARDKARLEAAAHELSTSSQTVSSVVVDTHDDALVEAMTDMAVSVLGGLDILVNSGAEPGSALPPLRYDAVTYDALSDSLDVKLMGYLRCVQHAAPYMIENGWGRIVNISGLAARQGGSIIGTVRNIAVSALTKNLADELGERGINVTVVHPGTTITERTSEEKASRPANNLVGRMITADEVASVITFLCSPKSVAITGDAIAAGGGVPGAIYY